MIRNSVNNDYARISISLSAIREESEESSGSLWKDRVSYVDLGALSIDDDEGSRELPLFLLGTAFYPSGRTQF